MDAEAKLKGGSDYNELLKAKFSMIDKEFEYYEDELTVLFEGLDLEKKERLKKVLVKLGKQYELLMTEHLELGYDPDILLDFLKEIPGRMRFILKTLTLEKTKKVEPPCSYLIPDEHKFKGDRVNG